MNAKPTTSRPLALAHRQGVRTVHQDLAVFPELTVAENLAIDGGFATGFGGRIRWRSSTATLRP